MKPKNLNLILILAVLALVSFVSADVISINSGGGDNLIINPNQELEGFFSASTISLSSCGTLSDTGGVYTLTQNLSSTGTCFTVGAESVTLDCKGYFINYSTATAGYGLVNNGYDSLNLKNCEFNMGNPLLTNSYGVYVYGGALYNIIDNVKVTTTSISSSGNKNNHGIYFNNALNSTIKNSNFTTLSEEYLGYNNYGIYLSSGSNNLVFNNSILTKNYIGRGIYINSPQNNVSGNVVNTLFTNSYGILVSGNDNYFYNNSVTTLEDDAGGDSAFGVYIYSGTNNVFRNNSIVTNKAPSFMVKDGYGNDIDISNLAEGKPIWYNDSLSDYTFQDMNFSEYGQVVCANCSNVTYDNVTVRRDGLLFGGTDNSFILNSDIISNTSHGVYLFYSDLNLINNTDISETQNDVNALKIRYSNYNNIENSYIYESTNEYAIYLQNADYNLFSGNLIDSYGSNYGVLFYGSTDYENFTQNTFNTVGYCMILDSSSSTESYFEKNDFNCGGSYVVYANRGSNDYLFTDNDFGGDKILFGNAVSAHTFNLTNATNFGGFYFSTETSNIGHVHWYLDTYVNDSNGADVGAANIKVWNNDSNLMVDELTDSNGWMDQQVLKEYSEDYDDKYYDGIYDMNTTKFGYFEDSRELDMDRNKIEYVTLLGTPPTIEIISPNVSINYTTLEVDFNISVNDDESISICLSSLDSEANVTMNELNNSYFWFEPILGPGPHNVTFYCNDTSNNWGTNFTNFTILDEAAIAISLSPALAWNVNWSIITLPIDDLDATGNNGSNATSYYVNISAENTNVDLYVRADGDLLTGDLDSIGLGNETFVANNTDPLVPDLNRLIMSTNYTLFGENLESGIVYMKFYLDAPTNQAAGEYLNNLDFKAVRYGQSP